MESEPSTPRRGFYPPGILSAVNHTEAKRTAASRGFPSVKAWMKSNRKAWHSFNSRLSVKGENRERIAALMQSLNSEFNQWSKFQ